MSDASAPLQDIIGWSPKPVTVEMTFADVDPEVLGILTGGIMGEPPAPTFSLTVNTPARRRTFWEWLRRKPKHLASSIYIPHATIGEPE